MDFHTIKRLPPYVFDEVNRMKAQARAAGADIIDLGMGNPDMPTPQHIVDKLVEATKNPRTHRYSASRGIAGLRKAIAGYYQRRFGVKLDPDKETIVTLGSKEGLAHLALAITAPGDTIIVPNPSYPIHTYGFILAGANIRHLPVGPGQDFMSNLARAVKHSIPAPRVLVVSYPSNPTAQIADLDFYREVVDFCRARDIFIISDIAYSEVYFDCEPPPSILQIDGAKEIAIEFTSLSKTYAMPGWRVGFGCGSPTLVHALSRVKSYLDYGAFTPIQIAGTAALNGPQDCVAAIRETYKARRDALVAGLKAAGWEIPSPAATMFAWAPLPASCVEMGSLEFAKVLLTEAHVAVSPGIGFGEYGEGYVRIALVENEQRIRQAARSIKKFLSRHHNAEPGSDVLAKMTAAVGR